MNALPVVVAEYAVHADDMADDAVRQHDVKLHITELLVVTGKVGPQAVVDVFQLVDGLQHHLASKSNTCHVKQVIVLLEFVNILFKSIWYQTTKRRLF